jgi:hypothetical protein
MQAWDDQSVDIDRTMNRIINGVLHHPAQRSMGEDGARDCRGLMFESVKEWWSQQDRQEYLNKLSRQGVENVSKPPELSPIPTLLLRNYAPAACYKRRQAPLKQYSQLVKMIEYILTPKLRARITKKAFTILATDLVGNSVSRRTLRVEVHLRTKSRKYQSWSLCGNGCSYFVKQYLT